MGPGHFSNASGAAGSVLYKLRAMFQEGAMPEDDSSLLDRSGIFYVSPRERRRKLTRRAQWALWALLAGFAVGFLAIRLLD